MEALTNWILGILGTAFVTGAGWGLNMLIKILTEIRDEIKKMNTKQALQDQMNAHVDVKLEDHEQRLRVIEKERA